MKLKSLLDEKLSPNDLQNVKIESPSTINQEDIEVLQEIYNKHKSNNSILDKKQSEVLRPLQKIMLST